MAKTRNELTDQQIEKIFDSRFEKNNSDQETIRKIESYGAKYDPNCFAGSALDQLLVCESLAEATPIKKKNPAPKFENNSETKEENKEIKKYNPFVSSLYTTYTLLPKMTGRKKDPEFIGKFVAKAVEDEDNVEQYILQAYERRPAFIRSALRITLEAKGSIRGSVKAYYWGVCNAKDEDLKRLYAYRARHGK